MDAESTDAKKGSPLAARVRLALWVLAAIVLLIVILQNTQAVETKILFATVTMPRALLLGIVLVLGFSLGVLASLRLGRRKR